MRREGESRTSEEGNRHNIPRGWIGEVERDTGSTDGKRRGRSAQLNDVVDAGCRNVLPRLPVPTETGGRARDP